MVGLKSLFKKKVEDKEGKERRKSVAIYSPRSGQITTPSTPEIKNEEPKNDTSTVNSLHSTTTSGHKTPRNVSKSFAANDSTKTSATQTSSLTSDNLSPGAGDKKTQRRRHQKRRKSIFDFFKGSNNKSMEDDDDEEEDVFDSSVQDVKRGKDLFEHLKKVNQQQPLNTCSTTEDQHHDDTLSKDGSEEQSQHDERHIPEERKVLRRKSTRKSYTLAIDVQNMAMNGDEDARLLLKFYKGMYCVKCHDQVPCLQQMPIHERHKSKSKIPT